MIIIIYVCIAILLIIGIAELFNDKKHNHEINNYRTTYNYKDNNKIDNIDYSMFYKKDSILTSAELNFYKELKKITDELNLSIFPQVDLERIINVKNNNYAYRNRIKSRSIDFTIVKNENCKIVCCIELDDYTHNRYDRQQRDIFINNLFDSVGIKLFRIKVASEYNMQIMKGKLKENI